MEGSCLLLSSSHHKNRVPSAGIPIIWTSQAGVGEIVAGQPCFPGRCIICWVTHPPLCTQVSPEKAWPLPTAQRAVGELHLTLREWQLCTGGSFSSLGVDGVPLRPGSPQKQTPWQGIVDKQLISEAVPENILWNWGRETGNGRSQ